MIEPIQPVTMDRALIISPVNPVTSAPKLYPQKEVEKIQLLDEKGKSFADYIREQLSNIVQLQEKADQLIQSYATGQSVNLQDLVLAVQRASLGLTLAITVRNKAIEAYTEITRMPI